MYFACSDIHTLDQDYFQCSFVSSLIKIKADSFSLLPAPCDGLKDEQQNYNQRIVEIYNAMNLNGYLYS